MQNEPNLNDTVKEEKFVKVAGVNSNVLRFPKKDSIGDNEPVTIGHVMMFDIEVEQRKPEDFESLAEDVIGMLDESRGFIDTLETIPGISFILKSSKGGYHVYNPVLTSLSRCNEFASAIELVDDEFADAGYNKGSYTLRISEKGDKQQPEPVTVVYGKRHKEMDYSHPHLQLLYELGFDEALTVMDECSTKGDILNSSIYKTRPENHIIDAKKHGEDKRGVELDGFPF